MALDGITVACLVREWQTKLVGGRIQKIAQPEPDALLLTVKNYDTYRLHLSASASLPLACLIPDNRPSPLTAPNFCMLLRKHLNSARILSVEQPDLERIIRIRIEHLDEMGDVRVKSLIIELMGKHSNIIFCDENDTVIDSIKRVSSLISSVREVLPGRPYFIPQTTEKHSLLAESADALTDAVLSCTGDLRRAIYTSITGVSPVIANELAHRAGFDTLSDVAEVIAGGDPARASLSAVLERLKPTSQVVPSLRPAYKTMEFRRNLPLCPSPCFPIIPAMNRSPLHR